MSVEHRIDEIGPAVREEARRLRRARQEAARQRARRARLVAFAGFVALATLVISWRALIPLESGLASDQTGPQTETSLLAASNPNASAEDAEPITPIFASYRTLQIFLPVLEPDLTEVAFHQASGAKALPIESLLPDADMAAATAKRGSGRIAPSPDEVAEMSDEGESPRILGGEVLRMWRANRSGQPDTAADIGAPSGAAVYAPVTGTVLEVKTYQLYGKYEDIEIHIQPTGWPEIDLVIIHVTDPLVSAGDRVIGGVSQVASVRLLSDRVNHQLADYSSCPGDHVHLQINRVEKPGVTVPAEES